MSPYNYGGNNPVSFSDRLGSEIRIESVIPPLETATTLIYNNDDGNLYNLDKSRYTGSTNPYINDVKEKFAIGNQTQLGSTILNTLHKSENKFTKSDGSESSFTPTSRVFANAAAYLSSPGNEFYDFLKNTIGEPDCYRGTGGRVVYSTKAQALPENGTLIARPFFTLFHELGHAYDANCGLMNNILTASGIAYGPSGNKIGYLKKSEWQGTYLENLLRQQVMNNPSILNYIDFNNLNFREYYELNEDRDGGYGVKLTPKGEPFIPYDYNPYHK